MASIPLPALGIRPPAQPTDPLEQFSRLQGIRSLMQRQQLEQGQQQLQQQQIQGATQENQIRQIQLQDKQAASQAVREWDGKDISDLPGLYLKHGASAQAILGLRSNIVDFQQKLGNAQKTDLENFKSKNDYIAGQLDSVAQLKDPAKISSALDDLGQNDEFRKMLSPQEQAQLPQIIQGLKQTAAQGGDVTGQLTELRNHHLADSQMADLAQKQQQTATSAQQEATSKATQAKTEQETQNLQQGGNQALADARYRNIQMQIQQKQPVSAEDKAFVAAYEKQKTLVPTANINLQAGLMNNQARDMAAENYFQTGQLPSGMRSPAMSAAIINRAAELHPGGATELAGNRAAYEANKKSYDNVTGTLDTLSAFEQSGLKNLKQFTDLASKLPDTGVPWLNTPVRLLDKNLVGAEYMPAIEAARSVALREIARVTNDPKLSGSLTDTARTEVSNFSPTNATLPQIKRVVEVLQNDMANVHSSLAAQKADIGQRLGIKTQSAQAAASEQKTQAAVPGPGSAKFHYQGSKGEIFSDDGKTWYDAKGQQIK